MERKVIFRCKVGSHLYGLQRPESDVDYFSVFIPTSEDLLGLNPVYEIDNSTKSSSEDRRNTSEDVDDKMYSLNKFMHLLLQNNPNIVEVLFATDNVIEILEPEFKEIMDNYDKIISQKVFHTFTGYAFSQKKKLTVKSERFSSILEGIKILERNYDTHDWSLLISESMSDILNKTLKYYKNKTGNTEHFHIGMQVAMIYEKLVEERDNYGWRVKTDTFDTLGYDVKFAYHLIRILAEGYDLLTNGKLSFPISSSYRQDIVDVREGKVSMEDLIKMYSKYESLCSSAKENTTLRKSPDFNWANKWLIKTLKNSIIGENE